MPGRIKVYDLPAHEASLHADDLHRYFMADGALDQDERRLHGQARGVYGLTEQAATWARIGIRWFGGGTLDPQLLRDLREAERVAKENGPSLYQSKEAA